MGSLQVVDIFWDEKKRNPFPPWSSGGDTQAFSNVQKVEEFVVLIISSKQYHKQRTTFENE